MNLKKYNKAESILNKAIIIFPKLAILHYNLANLYRDQEKFKDSLISYNEAIRLQPRLLEAYLNLGIVLNNLQKYSQAEIAIRKLISLFPRNVEGYSLMGVILRNQRRYKEAEISFREAISLNSSFAEAYLNLGALLRDLCKLNEAEYNTRKAIDLNPDSSISYDNLGVIFKAKNNLKKAEFYHRKAIKIDPENALAHLNLSNTLLSSNKFDEGWVEYEWRWKVKSAVRTSKLFIDKPIWNPFENGRLLLLCEQGIGDQLLFSTLIPDLLEHTNKLFIRLDKRLIPLFKRSLPLNIKYISNEDNINESIFDFYIPMGSLPRLLRTSRLSFEKANRFKLKVDVNRYNKIKFVLEKNNSQFNKIVGISWKSSSLIGSNKSLTLEQFILGIYSPNINFVCLQYGDVSNEIALIKNKYNIQINEVSEIDKYNNIDDLASLIKLCDDVVSIENVTVHLAQAIGTNTMVLAPTDSNFYLGEKGNKSYWYPSLRIFRQHTSGCWDEALNQIKNELITKK